VVTPTAPGPRPLAAVWTVLWAAFATFLLLVVLGCILGSRWVAGATDPRPVRLMVITGTVSLYSAQLQQWISVLGETRIREGDQIRTDGTSQAFLTFFDHSTVQVFPNSELGVEATAASRFDSARWAIELRLLRGAARIGVAPLLSGNRRFRLVSQDGAIDLDEGSYTATVAADRTRFQVVERGAAVAWAGGAEFALAPGQRIDLTSQGTTGPQLHLDQLVRNGDFGHGLDGWLSGGVAGFRPGQDVSGAVTLTVEDAQVAARFRRTGSHATFYETFLQQEVARDVSHFTSLSLALDLRLVAQSLSGGGYLGTEYPLYVRVIYRTASGDGLLFYGFYHQNTTGNRTDQGVGVQHDAWARFVAPVNLMALNPRPQRILTVQIGASGWDYESLVTNISLEGQ